MAEYNLQHAEHYLRLINDRFSANEKKQEQKPQEQKGVGNNEALCTIQTSSVEDNNSRETEGQEKTQPESVQVQPLQSLKKKRRYIRKPKQQDRMNDAPKGE